MIILWMLVSLLMLICSGYFWINDLIAHPQHGLFDEFAEVSARIREERLGWYRTFFILDVFWPLLLLLIVGLLVRDRNRVPLLNFRESRTFFSYAYVSLAAAAYLTDLAENACYWIFWSAPLPVLVPLKIAFYACCLGFLMYWLFKHYVMPGLKDFLKFVWTSLISIVFILLIYVLVAFMPQGGTLIVQLFYQPWNIVILFFLLSFLAIMVSHYPVYSAIWFYGDNKQVRLEMGRRLRFLGFGLIYYNMLKKEETKDTFDPPVVKALRRSMGILLYIALFNIVFGLIARFFEVPLDAFTLTFFLFSITLWIYYREGERYNHWKHTLSQEGAPEKEQEQAVREVVRYVRWFPRYFLIATLLVLVTAIVAAWLKWDRWSVLIFLITLGCQMFLYVIFKISRSYLKYVYRSERLFDSNPQMYNRYTLGLFKRFDPDGDQRGRKWLFRKFGSLSDNIQYLHLMRISGVASLLALLAANIWFSVASFFNPVVIIVLYIILYYSLFAILFKHALYYHRLDPDTYRYQNFFKFGIPMALVLVMGAAVWLGRQPNDLHRLREVSLKEKPLNYLDFAKSMVSRYPARLNNYFFVGSYGGGLKANLWNLLLLHELDRKSKGAFFEKAAVLSGVSGGAVGIGNYASLVRGDVPADSIAERIHRIGTSNVLSSELTYLLGRDWLREFIPVTRDFGKDRSFRSMEHHARLTKMSGFNEKGLEDYWQEIYRHRNRAFPALIFNSTAVGGQQGVSSSVAFPQVAFAGAIDLPAVLRNRDNHTLTYYGAVSTTNRFPFFSPTAKVKGVASFLDGGYFDNSGMLSAMGAYDALIASESGFEHLINPVFISIINSEDLYLSEKLRDFELETRANTETSEVGSILNTIVSIDKLPQYTLSKIVARDFAVELLMMPHKLSYAQMEDALSGQVPDRLRLMEYIEEHNAEIDMALYNYQGYDESKWGVVEPPLARLLSEPAVRYQQAMVSCHPDVVAAIDRIIEEYVTEDSPIDVEYQQRLLQRTRSEVPQRLIKQALPPASSKPE